MIMTEELARRYLGTPYGKKNNVSSHRGKQTELLMDWLEGQTHRELQLRYRISRSQVSSIIKQARE